MLPCGNQLLGHKHHDIFYSGEDVYISLHGSCEELNIHLEPDSIWMENTYVSLISTHSVPHQPQWHPSSVLLDCVAQPTRRGPELTEVFMQEHKMYLLEHVLPEMSSGTHHILSVV